MKTKLIILAAAGSLLLFSCTTDRNDDEQEQPKEVSKLDLKKLNINNIGEETAKVGDTILASPTDGAGLDPENNIDPSEGGDPKDVPPRK